MDVVLTRFFLFGLVCVLLLSACSDGGVGDETPTPAPPQQESYLAKANISSASGGRVDLPATSLLAGTSIVIPPGSLSQDTQITIKEGAESTHDGLLTSVISIGPLGTTFNPPARITLVYFEGQIPAGVSEADLVIAKLLAGDLLERLDDVQVDIATNQVSGTTASLSDFAIFTPDSFGLSHVPIAHAGIDQTSNVGQVAKLDASRSTDINGDVLSYEWALNTSPPGSQAVLSDRNDLQPSFIADLAGEYVAQLRVNDGQLASDTASVVISTQNSAPVANAGTDQTAAVATTVTLDGSDSFDVDGDQISFQWLLSSKPATSQAVLSDPNAIKPKFTVDEVGRYIGQLIVNDGSKTSAADTVTIKTSNSTPVANAGPNRHAALNESIELNGSQSFDVDGNEMSCRWSLLSSPAGSNATLARQTSMLALFSTDTAGTYVVQLIVDDGNSKSQPDTLILTVGDGVNNYPQADAGDDLTVAEGGLFTLDGSQSQDPNGDGFDYSWSLIHKPTGSSALLSDANSVNPTATADEYGSYLAQLKVSDGLLSSEPSTVLVSMDGARPVANAGEDQTVSVGETVYLDGVNSSDADGESLDFNWSLTTLPLTSAAILSDATATAPSFVMDQPGTAIAQLIVSDGNSNSLPDTVTITTGNSAPVANAGADQIVALNAVVTINGSESSDPEGQQFTYAWQLTDKPIGSTASLDATDGAQVQLTADSEGTYIVSLVVNDGELDSTPDQMEIVVTSQPLPKINSVSPTSASVGDLISISGENLIGLSGERPLVYLKKRGGGTVTAAVTDAKASQVEFTVPAGAETSPVFLDLGVEIESQETISINLSNDFGLTALPANLVLMQGQTATYAVTLDSSSGFTQLAQLAVAGMPAGVTASFKPQRVAVGQTAILTITAPANQAITTNSLTITATAEIEGSPVQHNANVTLAVQAVTTSLAGRVVLDDNNQTPLVGVVVSFEGINELGEDTGCSASTTTDDAGNFVFTNLGAECQGYQVVHFNAGTNVTNLEGLFAEVDQRYFIGDSSMATPPGPVHLPRIDTGESVSIIQNHTEDQHFAFETFPNLEITVYAGTTFTLRDGSQPDPFIMYAVDLESDRIPGQTPQMGSKIIPRLMAFQPDGTALNKQMAVTYPNVMNIAPGTQVPLLALDRLQGMLAPYGTGTVSANGLQIIPDLDPNYPGQRYGLRYLDWFAPLLDLIGDGWDYLLATANGLLCPSSGNPVDYATGTEVINEVDLAIDCSRGGIALRRTYRSSSDRDGPFGIGSSHNYGYVLDTSSPQNAEVVNLVLPNGARVPMSKPTVSDAVGGSPRSLFINTNNPDFVGNELTTRSTGESSYRWKDGRIFNFTPDRRLGVSHLVSITDPRGGKVTLHRNPNQLFEILQIEDGVGRLVNLEYDNRSRITTITDPVGRVLSYTYNSDGTLETVTDPESNTTRFEYDANDRLLRKFDELGVKRMENVYDVNGRVIKQTLADGGIVTFDYTLVNPGIGTSPVRSTAVTDPLGRTTLYRFNPQGHVISATDPLGQTTVFEREPGSNLLKSIKGNALCQVCGNPGAGDVSFEYGGAGNMTAMIDAAGNRFSFTYESVFNKVDSVTDPLGNQTFVQYDAAGNVTKVTDANGNETMLEYDIYGLLTTVTDPLGEKSTISYDGFANPIAYTDPLGNEFKTRYDAISRPTAAIDALGRRAQTVRDDLGRVTESVDADGQSTKFSYDAMGRMTALTDARGQTTSYSFDVMNRVVSRTDGLNKSDAREYDLNGRLINITDRKGQESSFEYDELNRPVRITFDDGSTVERRYDARSRVIEVIDSASGTYNYRYDVLGRLTESLSPQGTIQYQYDALGRITQQHVLGQEAVQYQYDAVGNLTQAKATSAEESYRYDARNQLTQVTRANNVSSDYLYDAAGRLLNIEHKNGADILAAQRYGHDANGQRITNRLSEAQAQITEASINEIDALSNQLNKHADITYTYDDNGNRLTSQNAQGTTQYRWDVRNRLVQITKPSGDQQQFFYDYAGNMVSQRVTVNGVTTTENYLTDIFTNVVFQSRSDGQQLSVLTASGIDQHLALIYGDGTVQYLLRDGLNSTMATVDGGGVVSGRYFYEAFGRTTVSGIEVPFQFTGRVPVGDGLYYYRARFYDTNTGRFVSQDPIGFGGGDVNLYGYVLNAPIMFNDPTGKIVFAPMVIGALVSGGINLYAQYQRNGCIEIDASLALDVAVGGVSGYFGLLFQGQRGGGLMTGFMSFLLTEIGRKTGEVLHIYEPKDAGTWEEATISGIAGVISGKLGGIGGPTVRGDLIGGLSSAAIEVWRKTDEIIQEINRR